MSEIGTSGRNSWEVSRDNVSLVRKPRPAQLLEVKASPQDVILDGARTAVVVIDMQNFFCAETGDPDKPSRRPLEPLQRLLPAARIADMPVVWVNWGTRPDRLNLSPSVQYTFRSTNATAGDTSEGPGISGVSQLFKGSKAAEITPELRAEEGDVHVDKHRISGFQDTELDSILRNLDINTLLFAGVNMDQCVMCTLQDASFLGYDCIMLDDCVATSSPDFCREATLYNVKRCFGFTCTSTDVLAAL